jgi:indole-3-glycerol phosphate synthase
VLLIVAALPGGALAEMLAAAAEAGVEALVEVHSEGEVERALASGAVVVGVNNRDLHTFAVHIDTSLRLAPLLPDHVVRVSESGIASAGDAAKVRDAGYDAVLVGEALVLSADPAALLRELQCS